MSPLARVVIVVSALAAVLVLSPTTSAFAAQTLDECMEQVGEFDEPPTCTEQDGLFVPSWPDDATGGGDGFGGFGILIVLVGLLAVGIVVWKVSTARRLATQSGMDPGIATQMTLLTDDGLEATYLAASLRQRADAPMPEPAAQATTATRLVELRKLFDDGLITQSEYHERRSAIIDAV